MGSTRRNVFAGLLATGVAACVPTIQRAERPGVDFQGPRFDVAVHRFISFDGTPLGLSAMILSLDGRG